MKPIINMAIPAPKILLVSCLLVVSFGCIAQHWEKPPARFYIYDIDKTTGEKMDLYSYLDKDVPGPEGNNCLATWKIFYFRVTAKGKIDSLFHEGTLSEEVTGQIVKNIYATEGHWKTLKGAKSTGKLWFVYPYFDLGGKSYVGSGCSEAEKLLQKNVIWLAESIGKIFLYIRAKGAFLVPPEMRGAGYSKECSPVSKALQPPTPRFYILDKDKTTGEVEGLYSYLKKNVPGPEGNNCLATWGVFYFRVTGNGKVDSLFHEDALEGTLRESVTTQIIKNIYATEGHWKIPKDTRVMDKLWFVYPYFDLGGKSYLDPGCSEAEKLLQKTVIELAESMRKIDLYTRTKGAFFVQPEMRGAWYFKE